MLPYIGIDLGTTNSVVAYMSKDNPTIVLNNEAEESTSSAVAVGRRGTLLVGAAAKRQLPRAGAEVLTSVKRFMGRSFATPQVQSAIEAVVAYRVTAGIDGGVNVWFGGRAYTPTEISSIILGRLREAAESRLNSPIGRAVITVPAYFGERQVAATREAGRMAGFLVLRVVDEPTAAALAYGYQNTSAEDNKTILVFDLGGGTFDISILFLAGGQYTVMGVEGDNLLGGDDFDQLIVDWMLAADGRDLDKQVLRGPAELAKIELSAQRDTEIGVPAIGTPPEPLDCDLSRDEFVDMIRDRVDGAITLLYKAVADAHLDVADIDEVLLVGGSTAIPHVQERLTAIFGRSKIRKDIHPMHSVALGAAIQGVFVQQIDCPSCRVQNPVRRDVCQACDEPLAGSAKIACPTCFLYSDADARQCWKCGGSLVAGVVADKVAAVAPVGLDQPEQSTFRCPSCRAANEPGVEYCALCRQPFAEPMRVNPKALGIELNDGSLSVIIDKNEPCPTPAPYSKEFATAEDDQRRLEIVVYEGADHAIAQNNELNGFITLALPPGLPRGTPVNVALSLDSNRLITVEVRIRAAGGVSRIVELQREGRLDPVHQQRLEARRLAVTKFLDRWSDELTAAEADVLYELITELEQAMVAIDPRTTVAELADRADQAVSTITSVRGSHAFLSVVQVFLGRFLDESDQRQLQGFADEFAAARQRADWEEAEVVSDRVRTFVNGFGEEMRTFVLCRTFAAQGHLTPALTSRVLTATRSVDAAFDAGDHDGFSRGMAEVGELWPAVQGEVDSLDLDVTRVAKPELGRGSA